MSKTNTFENDNLKLWLWGTTIEGIADNDATGPATNLYLSLHTADPGEAGDQTTSEASYTSYARVAVARSAAGFAITGNVATLVANATFPTRSGGSTTSLTHLGIGRDASGAGKLMWKAALDSPFVMTGLTAPVVAASTSITED